MSGRAREEMVARGAPPDNHDGATGPGEHHPSAAPDTNPRPPVFEPVARRAELPPGAILGVKAPSGRAICLFNQGGTIGAVPDCCTHAEFPLSEGVLHADGTIECVWHGARFDCRTGAARKAPAVDPVPVYEVRIEGDTILVGPALRRPKE